MTLHLRSAAGVLLALAAACAAARAADENWPRFRGPTGDGHAGSASLPLTWSESENIVWKTPIHDRGWSSPVVWGNQVWLTTATEEGHELFAVCVDLATGRVLHDLKLFHVAEPQFCHRFNSYASPTPAVEAGFVYVTFGSPGTACLDTQTGRVVWSRTDFVCDHFRGAGSSPILDDKRLYLSYDGADFQYVAALDKKTGETVWKTSRRIDYGTDNGDLKKAYSTPALIPHNGRAILISPAATATVAYDAETGEELWQLVHGGMNASMPPVYDRASRRLVVQSGDGGLGLVSAPWTPGTPPGAVAWSFNKAPSRSSPILVDGVLFMANNNGVGFALDALTGEQQWTERFGSSYSASPIFASGRIYFFSETGETHVVAPQRTFKLLALNQLETGFMASPAVVGNSLVVRTRTHLYRIAER